MANAFQEEIEAAEVGLISELAENAVLRLPGCADIMVRKALQEVYREFCRETKCLSAGRAFEVEDGKFDYAVHPASGCVVGEVRRVSLEGRELKPGRDYRVDYGTSARVFLAPRFVRPSTPESEDAAIPFEVRPSYAPPAEEHIQAKPRRLEVRYTQYPKVGSEEAPAWFAERHGDAIVAGVVARLAGMANRPWSDAQQAADERIRYENLKSEARMAQEVPFCGRFVDTSTVL